MFRVSPSAAVPHFALPPARASVGLRSLFIGHCATLPFRLRRSCPRIAIAPRNFPLRSGMVAGKAYQDSGVLYCLKYCRPDSILLVCDRIDSNSCSACFCEILLELFVLLFLSLVCYPNITYKKVGEKLYKMLRVPWV